MWARCDRSSPAEATLYRQGPGPHGGPASAYTRQATAEATADHPVGSASDPERLRATASNPERLGATGSDSNRQTNGSSWKRKSYGLRGAGGHRRRSVAADSLRRPAGVSDARPC